MSTTVKALTFAMAAAVLGSLLGGCALLFVSTDGLANGDAVVGEAGPGTGDAAGGGNEATTGTDAVATDGASTNVDGAVGFCDAHPGHTFCDDFDDRTNVTSGYETDQGGRTSALADVALFRSAPRSLRIDTPAGGSSAICYAHVGRTFAETLRFRLSFDLYVTPPGGPVGDSLGTVNFPQGYLDMGWFTSGVFTLTERTASPIVSYASAVKLPSGTWVNVFIEVTPGHVLVKLDDVTAMDTATTVSFSGKPAFNLGLYSEDALAIAANYDNILVDTSF